MFGEFAGYRPATKLDLIFGAKKMKTNKQLKPITYKDFCKKYGIEYGAGLRPDLARRIAKGYGYKIANLHNIVDDAIADGRY
jgi:hypothetical protein